jgi:hypothetical protein
MTIRRQQGLRTRVVSLNQEPLSKIMVQVIFHLGVLTPSEICYHVAE